MERIITFALLLTLSLSACAAVPVRREAMRRESPESRITPTWRIPTPAPPVASDPGLSVDEVRLLIKTFIKIRASNANYQEAVFHHAPLAQAHFGGKVEAYDQVIRLLQQSIDELPEDSE